MSTPHTVLVDDLEGMVHLPIRGVWYWIRYDDLLKNPYLWRRSKVIWRERRAAA